MIEEVFGGSSSGGVRKALLASSSSSEEKRISSSTCCSPPTASTCRNRKSMTINAREKLKEDDDDKLLVHRCPRCDSSNTKFCYYNNYNLTQPRYLCKTCRRYWTKGGALRNVPIGGGCHRKYNKIITSSSSPSSTNLRTVLISSSSSSSQLAKSHYDHHHFLSSNPINIPWPLQQTTSHHQNPNTNTLLHSLGVKEAYNNTNNLPASYIISSDQPGGLGSDPSTNGILWTNMNNQTSHVQVHQHSGATVLDHQLYSNRLYNRSSANYYSADVLMGNVMTSTSTSSSSNASGVLESARPDTGGGDQLVGHHTYWNIINSSLPCSHHLPTTNAAYP